MELWILFGVFTLLMLIGTPIAFCLGVASFATVLYMGLPPLVVFQRLNSGMSVFSLLAIPFFIYAGDLMVRGGIASRIVAFAGSLVGHVRGGLGQVNIATATLVRWHLGLGCRRGSRGRRADDPADEGARLWRRLCRQRHLDGRADRAAHPAVAQHDHLFDLGRRKDLDRRSVHRRHPARIAARPVADGDGVCRGEKPWLPDRALPGIQGSRAPCGGRRSRPAADRHHLRRRALRHLHRHRKLLHRRDLRAAHHRLRLSPDDAGRILSMPPWVRCAPRRWCCWSSARRPPSRG